MKKIFISVIFLIGLGASFEANANQIVERVPTQEEKQLLDLLVIAKVTKSHFDMSEPPIGKNIDGTFRINSQSTQINYNNCLTNDLTRTYNTPSDELAEVLLNENQPALFAINSIYSSNGIKLIGATSSAKIETLVNSLGKQIDIKQRCKDDTTTDLAWTGANTSELIVVPRFLLPFVLKTNSYAGLNDYELVSIINYDDLKITSMQIQQKINNAQNEINQIQNDYKAQAVSNNLTSVGSLVVSLNEYGNKTQKICTLSYNGDNAMSVIGYRELDQEFLTDDIKSILEKNNISLKSQNNSFDATYNNINDAYIEISKNSEACNIFVDFPKNIFDLKTALQKDGKNVSYGKLVSSTEAQKLFAQNRGYESKDEYNFAVDIEANLDQIKKLRKYKANSKSQFDELIKEMNASKYSDKKDIGTLLVYLDDKSEASKKKISPIAQRDARIALEKKIRDQEIADERKRAAEYAKNYPYEATLSCGFSGQHINIAACFAGSKYGVDTELEINNGGTYKMYKPWELQQAGSEIYGQGLTIALKKNFLIKAQNTDDTLLLGLKIRETATGRILYEKSVGRFGVIYFQK